MPEIVVTTEGFERVFAVLDRLTNPQWDQLLELIGLTVEEQTINHFQEQGGPEGPWVPRKRYYPWPILVKTPGTGLRWSIKHQVRPPDEVEIGTDVTYGRFHQEGTRSLPRRMFVGLSGRDQDELTRVIEAYLERLITP